MLREYDLLDPGRAKRILDQAERQTDHRISLERQVVHSDTNRSWCGLAFSFVVAMTLSIGGLWCISQGHDTAGATVITGTIGTFGFITAYGIRQKRKDLEKKSKGKK